MTGLTGGNYTASVQNKENNKQQGNDDSQDINTIFLNDKPEEIKKILKCEWIGIVHHTNVHLDGRNMYEGTRGGCFCVHKKTFKKHYLNLLEKANCTKFN